MSDPYGIIDLSALKQPAGGTGATDAGEPSAHEVAVTEQGLEQLIAERGFDRLSDVVGIAHERFTP